MTAAIPDFVPETLRQGRALVVVRSMAFRQGIHLLRRISDDPVQGRLHRSRRDFELLDEVGPDPHRDDDGDEDDLDVLLPGGGFVILHRLLARFGELFSHHLELAAFLRRVFDSGKEGDILGEDFLLFRPVDEVVVVTEKLAHPFGEGPPLLTPVLVERPLGEFLLAGFFEKEHGVGRPPAAVKGER